MDIQNALLTTFEIDGKLLPNFTDEEEQFRAFRNLLIQRIDKLFHSDFEKLKWILYRIDVSEKKLDESLKNTDTDVATVIADLIIARQIEKVKSRRENGDEEWSFEV